MSRKILYFGKSGKYNPPPPSWYTVRVHGGDSQLGRESHYSLSPLKIAEKGGEGIFLLFLAEKSPCNAVCITVPE